MIGRQGGRLKDLRKFITSWLPPLAWMGMIFLLSSQDLIDNDGPYFFRHEDKLAHFVVFGVLAVLLARALFLGWRRCWLAFWLAILGTVGYGALDELHQYFVPYRNASGYDLIADGLGALMFVWVWVTSRRRSLLPWRDPGCAGDDSDPTAWNAERNRESR